MLIDDAGHAVLCDFGLSTIKSDASTRSVSHSITSVVGSRNWMSPERIIGGELVHLASWTDTVTPILIGELRKTVDIYAFGMTMYEVSYSSSIGHAILSIISAQILTGKVPLGHLAYVDFIPLVVNLDARPERPDDDQLFKISDSVWSLAAACWVKTPQDRPTALAVCDTISSFLPPAVIALQLDTSPPRKLGVPQDESTSAAIALALASPGKTSITSQSSSVSNRISGSDTFSVPGIPESEDSGVQVGEPSTSYNPRTAGLIQVPRLQIPESSTGSTTAESSPHFRTSESTRPTTPGSIPPSQTPATTPIPVTEPESVYDHAMEGRIPDTSSGQNANSMPTLPPMVVQRKPLADMGSRAARESQSGGPGVVQPRREDSRYSARSSTSDTSSFDSAIGDALGTVGSSTGDDLKVYELSSRKPTSGARPTTAENSPSPKMLPLLRPNTEPAIGSTTIDKEGIARKQTRFRRMTSWIGSRRSNAQGPSLSPVQEVSGFKIALPGHPLSNSRDPSSEVWSLDDLLERWITRSSGELIVESSIIYCNILSRYCDGQPIPRYLLGDIYSVHKLPGGF